MSDGRRPLEGIRVLELASIVAGPFCGALMAEFGAEVIKTELPGKGDDLRRLGPSEGDCTYWWAVDNRNKKVKPGSRPIRSRTWRATSADRDRTGPNRRSMR